MLVRDWSIPMEMFAGTVYASATTRTFRGTATPETTDAAPTKLTKAEYLRPGPAPSNFLPTAVTPAPWPTGTSPEVSTGRTTRGKERVPTGPPIPR